MTGTLPRRRLLRTTAAAVAVAVAGCVSIPQTESDSGSETQRPSQRRGHQPRTDTGPHGPMTDGHRNPRGGMGPHHSPSGQHGQMGPHHGNVTTGTGTAGTLANWFANVDNYSGMTDRTGKSAVTLAVGARGNGGAFAYDLPAVRIDRGTTVTWEWTGEGGSHDVVAVDGTFESDLTSAAGTAFSHTFDEPGTVRYYCTPHRTLGMKGAVIVE